MGLFIEPAATNRCQNNNINPIDTTGFTDNNKGTLSIVDDSIELAAAGLDSICTSVKYLKLKQTPPLLLLFIYQAVLALQTLVAIVYMPAV